MKSIVNTTIVLCAALAGAVSCEFIEPEWVTPIALGAKQKVIELQSNAPGDSLFDIVSNCDYKLDILRGGEWIEITDKAERKIAFRYTQNNGFKRSARLVISAPGRVDSLDIRQPGTYEEYITIPADQRIFNVSAQGGQYRVDFATNILFRNLKFEAGSPLIGNVNLSKNSVFFEVLPTTSRDDRTFTLSIYAIDGWKQRVEAVITINQAKSK